MQTIPFTVGDDKIAFTTISPMLIAGESMTSEITLIKFPTEWEGYSYRMFITSPKKVKMDAIPITLNTPIPITNTMLDDRGSLIVEFGAYKDNTKVYRSRVTDSCKLRVHGSRSEEGTTSPDALPSVLSEIVNAIEESKSATVQLNTALNDANVALKVANMRIEVQTLAPGTPANAILTDEELSKVLTLGIPQGAPGKDGLVGVDGKSAYQSAITGGYTGNEAEFNGMLGNIEKYSESLSKKKVIEYLVVAGGGGGNIARGGNGGSGIVIIRYLMDTIGACTGGQVSVEGNYIIHTFLQDGIFTFSL